MLEVHRDLGSAACQPSAEAGAGPVAERARADEFDAVGGPCGEASARASEVAIAVLHGGHQVTATDKPEVDTLDDPPIGCHLRGGPSAVYLPVDREDGRPFGRRVYHESTAVYR